MTDEDNISETPRFELSDLNVTPRTEINATYMTTEANMADMQPVTVDQSDLPDFGEQIIVSDRPKTILKTVIDEPAASD